MSQKSITFLIIILIIITIGFFGYSYINKKKDFSDLENIGFGENFISTFFSNLTKDKNESEKSEEITDVSNNEDKFVVENQNIKLIKISNFPVSGFVVFMKERYKEIPNPKENNIQNDIVDEKKEENKEMSLIAPQTEFAPALIYVEKATGNIFQTFVDKINEKKFSDMTIENLYETYFGENGSVVISRYLKNISVLNTQEIKTGWETIMTHLGLLPKEILGADSLSLNKIEGSFLPENITNISISPNTSKIFYLFNLKGGVVGTISLLVGVNKTQIFNSQFTEWLSQWPNENIITLTTKPSFFAEGYMYEINPNSYENGLKKILGGINGLTTLTSPNGNLILYSDNTLSLNIYNKETKESSALSVKTLPEKCVWSKINDVIYCAVPKFASGLLYPDVWYKGETSFSDDIWEIDVLSQNAKIILDPLSVKEETSFLDNKNTEEIDGIKLALDENEDYLFFINKKDSYLWELKLK